MYNVVKNYFISLYLLRPVCNKWKCGVSCLIHFILIDIWAGNSGALTGLLYINSGIDNPPKSAPKSLCTRSCDLAFVNIYCT